MKTNQLQKNIPNGWQLIKLASVCNKEKSDISVNTLDFNSGNYPIYGASGFIKNIDFYRQKKGYISIIKDGAGVGRLTLHKAQTSVLGTLDILHENENSSLMFLYFLLQTIDFKKYIVGSTIPHIYFKDYKKEKIMIPLIPEQNRIVCVLETWDKVIKNLNKKIEIKKQTKKVLMKNLLTGKKRLAGFKDKWETKEIGELLDYEQPNKYIVEDTDYDDIHKTPVLTANKAFILGYTNEVSGIYKNNPVIIFDDFTMDNKFVDFDFKVKSSAIKILTPKNKDVNLKFVFERIQLINVIIGQHRRHYLSEYQYITIDTPNNKEQNAIAEILTMADKEIMELERKLEIIKGQKKFLLNNLITGTIRTPENLKVN